MHTEDSLPARTVSRRTMVKSSAAAGAGLWVAPSVFTFDRAAAAVGSCGIKLKRVDFSRWAGALLPAAFTSDDGSVNITMTNSDPDGVQDPGWTVRSYNGGTNGVINGLDNPVITGMRNATGGQGVTVTFTFDIPVQLSFFLVDVDALAGSWEDKVKVVGRLSPSTVDIDPATLTTGSSNTQITPNTVLGLISSNTSNSNVEVDFQTPIDSLTITHFDDTTRVAFQWIGIHDFHWC